VRQITLSIIAGLALTASAHAADLNAESIPAGYKDSFASVNTWTGFYAGLHAGAFYQGGNLTLDYCCDTPVPDTALNPKMSKLGGIGGALAGYSYQLGRYVLGTEGDIGFNNVKSTVYSMKVGPQGTPWGVWHADNDLKDQINGHLRARLGYADGALLLYISGGAALASADLKIIGICPPSTYYGSGNATLFGASVGAGAEYALSQRVTLRTEYLFDDYGRWQTWAATPSVEWAPRYVDLQTHTFRAAISYRFGGGEPLK
jgi:outer membrane immunogenic protein